MFTGILCTLSLVFLNKNLLQFKCDNPHIIDGYLELNFIQFEYLRVEDLSVCHLLVA